MCHGRNFFNFVFLRRYATVLILKVTSCGHENCVGMQAAVMGGIRCSLCLLSRQ